MNKAMKPSVSTFHDLRGIRIHVREWGRPGAPALFMLHGWADVSATFQFVVDAYERDWHVIAPDWRGHGGSGRGADTFWFPDYLADLDALLRVYSPYKPVRLVGHSMGGNIAQLYAGVRPDRVSGLVALEALGLPDRPADDAPLRLETWLDQLAANQVMRSHGGHEDFARRLQLSNPRLTAERAGFLARVQTEPDGAGGLRVAVDAAHRNVNPVPYRRAEAEACWRRIAAPVLWVLQDGAAWREARGIDDLTFERTRSCFANLSETRLGDCGHNMQHDRPEAVAAAIEAFFARVDAQP